MNRSVPVVVVLLVVALAGGLPAMADVGPSDTDSASTQYSTAFSEHPETQSATAAVDDAPSYDRTTFDIVVHENGSATWTFRYEQRFEGNVSEERAAFEEFAEEFESNETGLPERFTQNAESLVESGADLTDREMEATNFQRSATIEDEFGVTDPYGTRGIVEISFTWHGFAAVDDGTVTVGDVFRNIYLTDDQSIEITAGDGLTFDSVQPSADAQYQGDTVADATSVRWSGEYQFLDGHPHAVLVQDSDEDSSSLSSIDVGDSTWQYAIGALVVLVLVGGAVGYHRQRTDDGDGTPSSAAERADDEPATSSETDSTTPAHATDPDDSGTKSADTLTEEELLSDEDRVVELIRENGGRMKQVNIVEETGWSKSKVSMLLSDMEDEGTISKLRVGRENIISLEGFEPEATKSPFEE